MGKISKWALWADRKREDIQADKYLSRRRSEGVDRKRPSEPKMPCIPEWEEKMRKGVVLAKFVKEWGAEGKVFEHPKLQWRRSDNVDIFPQYVRSVG
ncbi:hypothetical protein CALVIDRAFT_569906, partial [Calocera viscosa TUFC12733]